MKTERVFGLDRRELVDICERKRIPFRMKRDPLNKKTEELQIIQNVNTRGVV